MKKILCVLSVCLLGGMGTTVSAMTAAEMMSYLPGHLDHVEIYSWDKPGDMRSVRGRGNYWSDEAIEVYCEAAKIIAITADTDTHTRMKAVRPDRLYQTAYINLGRDYNKLAGAYATNPEYYCYNEDGSLFLSDDKYPYFNFQVPGCITWWLSEARRQVRNVSPSTDVFFMDGFAKLFVISGGGFYDYWGNEIGDDYMDSVSQLLKYVRNVLADEVVISGNIMRQALPEIRMDYTLNYNQMSYMEGFEAGNAYYQNISILNMQTAAQAGQVIRLVLTDAVPYGLATPLTETEMKRKAYRAMPDLYTSIPTTAERIELAEAYAYFDYKLALFLICAEEDSYLEYNTPALVAEVEASTDMWKVAQPFPEYDMKLGKPLEDGYLVGDTWRRQFQYVEVVVNMADGTCEFND